MKLLKSKLFITALVLFLGIGSLVLYILQATTSGGNQRAKRTAGLLLKIKHAIETTRQVEGSFAVESAIIGLGNRNLEVALALTLDNYLKTEDANLPTGKLPSRLSGKYIPFTRSANYAHTVDDFGREDKSVYNNPGLGLTVSFFDITTGLAEVISVDKSKPGSFGHRILWKPGMDPAAYQAPFTDYWNRPIVIDLVKGLNGFRFYSFGPRVYVDDDPKKGFYTADDITLE